MPAAYAMPALRQETRVHLGNKDRGEFGFCTRRGFALCRNSGGRQGSMALLFIHAVGRSFVSQGIVGIHLHGAPGRNQARKHGHRSEGQ